MVGVVLCVGGCGSALAEAPVGHETGASASPAPTEPQSTAPTGSFLSSLKQAFNHNYDQEVVRGHFDVGSAPDSHRYYCLVDPKTGKREANGVAGQPVLRSDGMTAIESGAVSFYSCVSAEQQGLLVTAGYKSSMAAKSAMTQPLPAPPQAGAPAQNGVSAIDVAGVRLGMTPDQVRSVLRSKKLLDYYESAQTLRNFDSAKSAMQSTADGSFVNIIAASTAAASDEGESYQVMFTPVPGKERVMAIVHSGAYSPAVAVPERTVQSALVTKYGGYSGAGDLPESPTWRFQSSGAVLVGDSCNRRGLFGGLSEINVGIPARQNIALKTTADEFRFQIDRCGVAIVTEDHSTANANAPGQDRIVKRFTVTAYSPSIGLDGATTALQLIQSAGNTVEKTKASLQPTPNL